MNITGQVSTVTMASVHENWLLLQHELDKFKFAAIEENVKTNKSMWETVHRFECGF